MAVASVDAAGPVSALNRRCACLHALQPAIILVEPKRGVNIGAAARAMKNFGLRELRLVKPVSGWPNEEARAVSARAVDVIDAAKVQHDSAASWTVPSMDTIGLRPRLREPARCKHTASAHCLLLL